MFKKKKPAKNLKCLNCETTFDGWFCPNCGQRSETARLNSMAVVRDFLDALSDSDKGILRTLIDLSQNPGEMLNDYLGGKRRRYLSAGKYTLLFVVLFTLNISLMEKHFGAFEGLTRLVDDFSVTQDGNTIHLSDEKHQKKLLGKSKDAKKIEGQNDKLNLEFKWFGQDIRKEATKKESLEYIKYLIPKYHKTLFDTLKILLALWIPIFAFFSFVLFRKLKLNFAEHVVINSYIYAQMHFFTLVLSGIAWFIPNFVGTTSLTIFVVTTFYLFFAYIQIFSKARRRLLKTIVSVFLAGSVYILVLFTVLASLIAVVAIENIDQL